MFDREPYKNPDTRPSDMVKAELQKIEKYAKKLNEMIHPEDELEGWVQSKLAIISANIGDVKHYLDYELYKMAEGGYLEEEERDDEIKIYRVAFMYEDSDGMPQISFVDIAAEDIEEAVEIAEDKYENFYDKFEITSCDLIAEGDVDFED